MSSSDPKKHGTRQATGANPPAASSQASIPDNSPNHFSTPVPAGGRERLPFLAGRVIGEGGKGSFTPGEIMMPSIQREYRKQPAFAQPREDWSHWDNNSPIRLTSKDELADVGEKLRDVTHPYYSKPGSPVTWATHCSDLWDLFDSLDHKKMTSSQPLLALLRMLTYGLEDIIAIPQLHQQILRTEMKANKDWPVSKQSPFLPEDYLKVDGKFKLTFAGNQGLRQQMAGCRFFAGIILHQRFKHWTSFIFDRVAGQYYHFDSYLSDRKVRLQNAVLLWRETLANLGLPFDFTFYQLPLAIQHEEWECGLVCVYELFLTLRGLVGIDASQASSIHPYEQVHIDGPPDTNKIPPFQLRLRDWVLGLGQPKPLYRTKVQQSWKFIEAFFQCLILEELGIADGMYIQEYQVGKGGKNIEAREERPAKFKLIRYRRRVDRSPVPQDDLYTDFGGFMHIWPAGLAYKKGWVHNRLIPYEPTEANQGIYHELTIPAVKVPYQIPPMDGLLRGHYQGRGVTIENGVPKEVTVAMGTISLIDSDDERAQAASGPIQKTPPKKAEQTKAEGKKPAKEDNSRPSTPLTPGLPIDQLVLETPKPPQGPKPSAAPTLPKPKVLSSMKDWLSKASTEAKTTPPASTPPPPPGPSGSSWKAINKPPPASTQSYPAPPVASSKAVHQTPPASTPPVPSAPATSWNPAVISGLQMGTAGSPKSTLPQPKSDISMKDADDEYAPSTDSSELTDPMDVDSLPRSQSPEDRPPRPVRRRAWPDEPPTITDAEIIPIDDLDASDSGGLARRKNAAADGPRVMSVTVGGIFDLPSTPGQETALLPTGHFATYVPPGLASPADWDSIYHQIASFIRGRDPSGVPALTREQRMKEREKKRGN